MDLATREKIRATETIRLLLEFMTMEVHTPSLVTVTDDDFLKKKAIQMSRQKTQVVETALLAQT